MSDEHSLTLIKESAWFKELAPSAHHAILSHSVEENFAKDCWVINRGDEPKGLYGILGGKVRISGSDSDGNSSTLMTLAEGHWFGEISCIDNLPCVHDVCTLAPSKLLFIPKQYIQQMMKENQVLTNAITLNLCYRLRQSLSIIEQTNTQSLEVRLACRLLSLSQKSELKGEPTYNTHSTVTTPITIDLSQQDLADMLGVSRQSVSKIIKRWKQHKIISIEYATITLLDRPSLQTISSPNSIRL